MNYFREPDIKDILIRALREDIGRKDITTEAVIPAKQSVKAILLAKERCVVCGLGVARAVFRLQDKNCRFRALVKEGDYVTKGMKLALVSGKARPILSAERVALNFLTRLCGISTLTKKFTDAVKPYKVKILDTRKTTPGLRLLEKYAVRMGGGFNHRMSLDEMLLVKDNHWKAAKGCIRLPPFTKGYQIEIEVRNLKEFRQALKLKPDIIMLDNMSIKDIKEAVKIRNQLSTNDYRPTTKLEASGGINLKNIRRIASCGVEQISVGALTHSVNSADISLEIL